MVAVLVVRKVYLIVNKDYFVVKFLKKCTRARDTSSRASFVVVEPVASLATAEVVVPVAIHVV